MMPNTLHNPPEHAPHLFSYTLFALLVAGVLALHSAHFGRRLDYRDDEIRTVHAGRALDAVGVLRWMSVDIHPPLWRVTATAWVRLFGVDERVTRWLSSLYTALALAAVYRFARDLFDAPTALLAVYLVGTHALFMFYAHELRPYSALVAWSVASSLVFVRWLRAARSAHAAGRPFATPAARLGLFYVVCGAAALYTHFVAGYVLVAHAVVFAAWSVARALRVRRLDLGLALRFAGLLTLIGLAFGGWLPSLMHSVLVVRPSGITYGLPPELQTPAYLYSFMQMRPAVLGNLALGVALLVPLAVRRSASAPDGEQRRWSRLLLITLFAVPFAAILVTDQAFNVLTERNLIITLVPLVILLATGARRLPPIASGLFVLLVANTAAGEFISYQRNAPYREARSFIAQGYAAGDPIVISVDAGWGSYFTFAYYLIDTLGVTQEQMVYLTLGTPDLNLPVAPLHHLVSANADDRRVFDETLGAARRVWWLDDPGSAPPYAQRYRDQLAARCTVVREQAVTGATYRGSYVFREYACPEGAIAP